MNSVYAVLYLYIDVRQRGHCFSLHSAGSDEMEVQPEPVGGSVRRTLCCDGKWPKLWAYLRK